MPYLCRLVLPFLFGVLSVVQAAEERHRTAAAELVRIMDMEETFMTAYTTVTDAQLDAMKRNGMSEAKLARVKELLDAFAKKVYHDPALIEGMVALYEEEFTEAEIRELIAFYETPTGRKALEKMPVLMQKGAKLGQDIAERHQAELQADLMKVLQAE